jgi:A/G-specific adenine glycosylase
MDDDFGARVTGWYAGHARDLPWRQPDATPWAIVVSEFMLQQTPVARVLPVWAAWLSRWPTPSALADESPGEAVRAWGRLGYPRRALRLHATARAIVERHAGFVPRTPAELRSLPGVGDYTAAAVASFAFGARLPVLDTNVRRVYARVFAGVADATGSPTVAERAAALDRVPDPPGSFSVAVMELGAVICTARTPRCGDCPVARVCRWRAAGYPPSQVARRTQSYAGTDREVRGRLLAVLRGASEPVDADQLGTVWPDAQQRDRALSGLLADGLVERCDAGYRLPA